MSTTSTNKRILSAEIPFDLYGDLEDAYEKAELDGDVEIVETMDAFGLWDDRPKSGSPFMHKIWRALRGDVEAQADVGHAFYWNDDDPDETREEYKWLDRPVLAIYWYNLAAKAGYDEAQNDLALLYCPDLVPYSEFKIGRFSRHWREKAAAQKLPDAMRSLAYCLRCGQCSGCPRDIQRAAALDAEADRIEQGRKEKQ